MKTRLANVTLFSSVAALAFAATACGSSDSTGDDTTDQNSGVTRGGTSAAALEQNPYGVAYPTEGIGTKARVGTRAGDKIKNFKFSGYPDGLAANGMRAMKLADYYDPALQNNVKLIHIQASGSWCVYCKQESDTVAPQIDAWRAKGVVYILSMAEGASNSIPAEQKDLDNWLVNHNLVTPAWLDAGDQQLGVFYDAAAMPWNATIDATTMEIIDSHMGFEGLDSIQANFDKWLAAVKAQPATP